MQDLKQVFSINKSPGFLGNEHGSALILALIMMAVLTLVGVSVINTATVEYKIVRNERIYQDNFYKAESAVLESLQMLESQTKAALDGKIPIWLTQKDDSLDMGNTENWDTSTNASVSAVFPTARYALVQTGIVPGASLDMSATSHLYGYIARGQNESNNGRVIIEMGYRKRH